MSDTKTVSPLRQRMIEDMAARKLNPHTQRSYISSCLRFAARLKRYHTHSRLGLGARRGAALSPDDPYCPTASAADLFFVECELAHTAATHGASIAGSWRRPQG